MIYSSRLNPRINILRKGKENDTSPKISSSPNCMKNLNNLNNEAGPLKSSCKHEMTFKGLSVFEIKKGATVAAKAIDAPKALREIEKFIPEHINLAIDKAIRYYGKNVPTINVTELPVQERFILALKSPIEPTKDNIKYLLRPDMRKELKAKDVSNRMIGSLESVYRQVAKLKAQGKSDEEIKKIIAEGLIGKLDKLKPNFSMNVNNFTVRMVTGILGAFFIATDFGNLKRMVDDDPALARDQWIRKFRESVGAAGLSGILGYITNTTYKQTINASLPFAVIMTTCNALLAELVIRKLLGRPILPVKPKKKSDNQDPNSCQNSCPSSPRQKICLDPYYHFRGISTPKQGNSIINNAPSDSNKSSRGGAYV